MWHVPFFRIFYSTSFTILLLITLALLAVTPINIGYLSFKLEQRWNIVIVSGVYVLVFLVTLFIYATRLYTTRTHLASIPKFRMPLQKGDLPSSVRRMVLGGIDTSASVAFKARPRDLTGEDWESSEVNVARHTPDAEPVPTWGNISHPGCSAPHDQDMPNMHYEPVLKELPHLLEARAVSLAPPDPLSIKISNAGLDADEIEPIPDPRIVALLQRTPATSLRAYIAQLADLGVLESIEQAAFFVRLYERARFAPEPLREEEFRNLMESFAEILDTMQDPDPEAIAEPLDLDKASSISASQISRPPTRRAADNSQVSLSIRQQKSMASLVSASSSTSVVRTRSRPQIHRNQTTSDSSIIDSDAFATPGLTPGLQTETPFHTPYPIATSTKTASTGSLAGSEGSVQTARSRIARTSRSGNRTPSAFSRRSKRSRRSRSRGGFGLGVRMTGREDVGYDHDMSKDAPQREPSSSGSVVRGRPAGDVTNSIAAGDQDSDQASTNSGGSVIITRNGTNNG